MDYKLKLNVYIHSLKTVFRYTIQNKKKKKKNSEFFINKIGQLIEFYQRKKQLQYITNLFIMHSLQV